jgi:hypothetical protein
MGAKFPQPGTNLRSNINPQPGMKNSFPGFTLACMFKVYQHPSGYGVLMAYYSASNPHCFFMIFNGSRLYIDRGSYDTGIGINPCPLNSYEILVATHSTSDNITRLYHNGAFIAASAPFTGGIDETNIAEEFGNAWGAYPIIGEIQWYKQFAYALSANEVMTLCKTAGHDGFHNGCYEEFRFDGVPTDTLIASGNFKNIFRPNNTLTVAGNAIVSCPNVYSARRRR